MRTRAARAQLSATRMIKTLLAATIGRYQALPNEMAVQVLEPRIEVEKPTWIQDLDVHL